MSFSSVVYDCIRIVDTSHEFENPEKIIGCIDMELEPDFSYSSHLISVTYPIVDQLLVSEKYVAGFGSRECQ